MADIVIRRAEPGDFALEGTQRAYALRAGVFVDAIAMARLHPNPPQLPHSS